MNNKKLVIIFKSISILYLRVLNKYNKLEA
jgi:hypothetical protein